MTSSEQFASSYSHPASAAGITHDLPLETIHMARPDGMPPSASAVQTGIYVTVHGHFYQPPRENPYLNAIERQPSAAPFHNWNERIHHECYRPNAFARVLNDQGELLGIVNNFEYLSFNVGPTLMSWLEQHDVEVYRRILEADRNSAARLNGHGNAIAQVYNHIILPLASERDKLTQIRWGKTDFHTRFGRNPEGMWLAETAVDYATVKALIQEGIRFIILAPSQAERCRPLPTATEPNPKWHEVGGSQIDPIQPYRCFLPGGDRQRDYLDIFFYDGPISRDMGFSDALSCSHRFANRLGLAIRGDHRKAQLISVATDGETFGHHKGGTEKALAYAFSQEFPRRGWIVTNFAHYLSLHPPAWEVELKPVTAWSCSHGVDRWQEDCGCGGGGGWNQKWRRPLRDSLNWLRDQLVKIYDEKGRDLLKDPWKARDEYIQIVLDRSPTTINHFFNTHQTHKLSQTDRVDALRLLEMQRHALLMFTSCGWFFEEVSRPEGTQILRYAARALELAEEVSGVQLEKAFVKRLTTIPSNIDCFASGAEVYRQLVVPARISLDQMAAHYAISAQFNSYPQEQTIYCYTILQTDYQLQRLGSLTLSVGQIQLTSEMTREVAHRIFAVLHMGGWDFHCCIKPFEGRRTYTQLKESLFDVFRQASATQVILAMARFFGEQSFSLQNLFAEERHRMMHLISQETLTRLDQLYTQVYRDNYGVLMAFHRDELDVPQELQVAAEIAIGHRALTSLQGLERETVDFPVSHPQLCYGYLTELEAIAAEAQTLRCHLKHPQIRPTLERLILRFLWHLLNDFTPGTIQFALPCLERLITTGKQFDIGLTLDRAQELYLKSLYDEILPRLRSLQQGDPLEEGGDRTQLRQLVKLGQQLAVDVTTYL